MGIFSSGGGGGHSFDPPTPHHSGQSEYNEGSTHSSGGGRSFGERTYVDSPNSARGTNEKIVIPFEREQANPGTNGRSSGTASNFLYSYTSSNTAGTGRLNAEYLGGTDKVLGEHLRMIPNYIYFYHLDKFCILPLYPDSISDNMSATFGKTDALSRTAPVFSYSNSGPRSVQIKLDLHRDLMNDLNKNISNLKENVVDFNGEDYVDLLVKYLQSSALPRYRVYNNGSKSVEPPMVALRFGNTVFIKGVIDGGVNVTYEKPIMVGDKYAKISVNFSVFETDPYDADSVVRLGSFRGVCATNNIFKD